MISILWVGPTFSHQTLWPADTLEKPTNLTKLYFCLGVLLCSSVLFIRQSEWTAWWTWRGSRLWAWVWILVMGAVWPISVLINATDIWALSITMLYYSEHSSNMYLGHIFNCIPWSLRAAPLIGIRLLVIIYYPAFWDIWWPPRSCCPCNGHWKSCSIWISVEISLTISWANS